MGKRKTQPEQELTRKQRLISRREKEQLRYIYMGLGLVAVLVVIVLAFGAVQTFIIEPNSPVAIVNGTEISTGDYQTRAQYERFLLGQQYQQLLAQQASFAQSGDEQLAQLLQNQFQQYSAQLAQQLSSVDQTTLDTMIDDLLIKADADEKGITVSEEEVDEFINRFLARREGGLTASAVSETATAAVEASATAALWTPTPTFTPSPTLTATESLTTTESITPTATPADTPTPAPTPTPNVIAENDLSTAYQNWLVTLNDEAGVDEAAYRSFIRSLVLRTKHQEAFGEDVPTTAEQSHARHILVETEEEAQTVIERLNAGEDFATLAEELSADPGSASQGGDLGFVSRGDFVEAVDEAVFTLPIGEISEPIETQFGWHVIEVLEREERELSPGDYSRQQQVAYNDWLTETRTSADIENLWTPDKAPSGSPLDILNDITPPTPPSGS